MARGRPRGSRNKLPRELIGRNLSVAQLYVRSDTAKLCRLLIRGDRGVLDLKLTREETAELLNKMPQDPNPDTLGFTFTLVPGTVDELRRQFERKPKETTDETEASPTDGSSSVHPEPAATTDAGAPGSA